jgi:hypothetical protein
MTSLLLGSQQLTSRSGSPAEIAHPNRPLEGLADASELGPSKLLRIARELAYGAQNWPGMKKPARRVWELIDSSSIRLKTSKPGSLAGLRAKPGNASFDMNI